MDARKGRYAKMLARSATAAICADRDGTIVGWNSAAEKLFGHSRASALGKHLSLIIPPRMRAAHEAGFAQAVRTGEAGLAGQSVEVMILHADGHEIPVDLSLSMWMEGASPMFGALMRDISDRHAATQKLAHLAHCDTLTSLPNRSALLAELKRVSQQQPCTLLLLDLDGFKDVNDSLGHSAGDGLLIAVAERLSNVTSSENFVARLGGDEFAILLPGCADVYQADAFARNVFRSLANPFSILAQSVFVGTSIGIAMAKPQEEDADTLLAQADLALYHSKSLGGGVRSFFVPTMQNRTEQRLRLGTELRQAFAEGEFELWFQPQISIRDRRILGVEALLRWHHPRHGLLAPNAFIDVLSDSVIASDVGKWILNEACSALADWQASTGFSIRIGVNLFPAQLRSDTLYDTVVEALDLHSIAPNDLELEITENTVLRLNEPSTTALRRLKDQGVGIAFDDFGTGFASLSMLQQFPLTRLKIDRTFISQIGDRPGDAAIVRALMCMAQTFSLDVIAEGVETAEQEAVLREMGCFEAQGFRYGRPMHKDAIADLLLASLHEDTGRLGDGSSPGAGILPFPPRKAALNLERSARRPRQGPA